MSTTGQVSSYSTVTYTMNSYNAVTTSAPVATMSTQNTQSSNAVTYNNVNVSTVSSTYGAQGTTQPPTASVVYSSSAADGIVIVKGATTGSTSTATASSISSTTPVPEAGYVVFQDNGGASSVVTYNVTTPGVTISTQTVTTPGSTVSTKTTITPAVTTPNTTGTSGIKTPAVTTNTGNAGQTSISSVSGGTPAVVSNANMGIDVFDLSMDSLSKLKDAMPEMDEVVEAVNSLWELIKKESSEVIESVKEKVAESAATVREVYNAEKNILQEKLEELGEEVASRLSEAVDKVGTIIDTVVANVQVGLTPAVTNGNTITMSSNSGASYTITTPPVVAKTQSEETTVGGNNVIEKETPVVAPEVVDSSAQGIDDIEWFDKFTTNLKKVIEGLSSINNVKEELGETTKRAVLKLLETSILLSVYQKNPTEKLGEKIAGSIVEIASLYESTLGTIPRNVTNDTLISFFDAVSAPYIPMSEKKIEEHARHNLEELTQNKELLPEGRYIEYQSKWKEVLYGNATILSEKTEEGEFIKSSMAYSGCEIIATANASKALGEEINAESMTELISDFERNGMTMLGGFGVTPTAIAQYFEDKGYDVEMTTTTEAPEINKLGERSDTLIVTVYNDKEDITAMIHTVSITKTETGKYSIHNNPDTSFEDEFSSLSDAIKAISSDTVIETICVIGINNVTTEK